MEFEIIVQVKLKIEAKSRNEALKLARQWQGETCIFSCNHILDWKQKQKIISCKQVKTFKEA